MDIKKGGTRRKQQVGKEGTMDSWLAGWYLQQSFHIITFRLIYLVTLLKFYFSYLVTLN